MQALRQKPAELDLRTHLGGAVSGAGLFAHQHIQAHEVLGVLENQEGTVPNLDDGNHYLYRTFRGGLVDWSNEPNQRLRFINHSSTRPNVELAEQNGRTVFRTIRPIQSGEELTMDYGRDWETQNAAGTMRIINQSAVALADELREEYDAGHEEGIQAGGVPDVPLDDMSEEERAEYRRRIRTAREEQSDDPLWVGEEALALVRGPANPPARAAPPASPILISSSEEEEPPQFQRQRRLEDRIDEGFLRAPMPADPEPPEPLVISDPEEEERPARPRFNARNMSIEGLYNRIGQLDRLLNWIDGRLAALNYDSMAYAETRQLRAAREAERREAIVQFRALRRQALQNARARLRTGDQGAAREIQKLNSLIR